jgi:2'-5' RNA ligase
MPRLFTGIQLPSNIVARLSMLSTGLADARWIEPCNFHITLSFIGDIDMHQAGQVAGMLATVEYQQFSLALSGLDIFGSKKPRSLFVRVAASEELINLQRKQEQVLRQLGLCPDKRKFVPHVTFARFRAVKAQALSQYLAANGSFETKPFLIEQFVLYSARDSTGGGPYVVEQSYPLKP